MKIFQGYKVILIIMIILNFIFQSLFINLIYKLQYYYFLCLIMTCFPANKNWGWRCAFHMVLNIRVT